MDSVSRITSIPNNNSSEIKTMDANSIIINSKSNNPSSSINKSDNVYYHEYLKELVDSGYNVDFDTFDVTKQIEMKTGKMKTQQHYFLSMQPKDR